MEGSKSHDNPRQKTKYFGYLIGKDKNITNYFGVKINLFA
jgi:hypothetical protein